MFNIEQLETTDFYRKRFGNFATMIVVPSSLLVVAMALFLIFAQHDITVSGTAELIASGKVQVVQSISNDRITMSHLQEGKQVRKGEVLVTYHSRSTQINQDALTNEMETVHRELYDLKSLIMVIQGSSSRYTGSQTFGYENELKNYQAQRQELELEIEQIESAHTNTKSIRLQTRALRQKVASLQFQMLQSLQSKQAKLQQSLTTLKSRGKLIRNSPAFQLIKAQISGEVHINPDFKDERQVPTGSTLAEIYPNIRQQHTAQMKMMIPVADVAALRKNQPVRIRIVRNLPSPLVINGFVKQIDVAPTLTKQGNVLGVAITLRPNSEQRKQLHYGMSAQAAIVTGTSTWWQFLWSRVSQS